MVPGPRFPLSGPRPPTRSARRAVRYRDRSAGRRAGSASRTSTAIATGGVATSLTRIGDARQLHHFDSLERSLIAVSADREADRFLPKVWRGHLAILLSQHRQAERLHAHARREQARRNAEVLARVPQHLLHRILIQMSGSDVEVLRSMGLRVAEPETLQLGRRRAAADLAADVDPDARAGGAVR